ncbi:hypothetical protein LCGC14_2455810 [marine sediment metagenome]|uniref:Helix-turn-helix domain-containing protein n=1 Tax=marine sediment metagenome TaxID=412755 RepID=A0A0F9C2D0_9ZZZZ
MSQPKQNGKLLSLEEAATALGYTVKGLRKIVDRSRARAHGARTRGPTIKFFQTTRGAPIRFRPEWIEEFIVDHTVDPDEGMAPQQRNGKKKPVSEIEAELLNL